MSIRQLLFKRTKRKLFNWLGLFFLSQCFVSVVFMFIDMDWSLFFVSLGLGGFFLLYIVYLLVMR